MKLQKMIGLGFFAGVFVLALVCLLCFGITPQKTERETVSQQLNQSPVHTNTLILLQKPTIYTSAFPYNGNDYTIELNGFDATKMELGGDVTHSGAGEYVAIVSIIDKTTYAWDDGSGQPDTNNVLIPWRITKKSLTKPTIVSSSFIYNGNEQQVDFHDFVSADMELSGDLIKTNANTSEKPKYTAVVLLKDKQNTQWDDETTNDLSFDWVIKQQRINVPVLTQSRFVYTGNVIKLEEYFSGFAGNIMQLDSYGAKTDPGIYKTRLSLKDPYNYAWASGTSGDQSFIWEIIPKTDTWPFIVITLGGVVIGMIVLAVCAVLIDPKRKK